MTCPAVLTGARFLSTTLAHFDCQGQVIGAYGYGALSDPGSIVASSMTALLTIFIALFGYRLLLGHPTGMNDVVGGIIRVGLMLALALSWPAWRIIGYDVVIKAPGEVSGLIGGASGLPGNENTLISRLQNVDDGIVAVTRFGTGRLTGGVVGNSDRGDSFHGIAMADDTGFGWGRVLFLISALGPYGIIHVGGGILLAVTPVMAGLMLFGQTMGIFVGWVRGLVLATLGSVALTLAQGVELSILAPWLNDVLSTRDSNTFTPSSPTELLVLGLAFCLVNFGILALIARVVFMPNATLSNWLVTNRDGKSRERQDDRAVPLPAFSHSSPHDSHSRATTVAEAVASSMRHEAAGGFLVGAQRREAQAIGMAQSFSPAGPFNESNTDTLGSSFRRSQRRTSAAGQKRDRPV